MSTSDLLPVIQRKNPEREFEILKQIGSGTYGEVYKAKVVKTKELVALKIIKIEPGEDFNIIQQEIQILSDCKHSNIVGYHGSYLSSGYDSVLEEERRDKLWIAMEFCGGGSLQDIYHVTNTGLNELQIAFVCRETLKGLQYLHERNKMHRDIKGANILLTDDGDVKLADFGIAAQLTQTLLMKRKSFIGTPYWMAPEVAAVERKGGYNHQCDIWAVGITAVELAETQPPMFDLHPMRALYLMTKRNFKSPGLTHKNKWSDNFHDFLRHALQKDPKRRPTAAELLKHEYVARPELCSQLMLSLIKVLEAPHPKTSKHSVTEDMDDDKDDEEVRSSNQKKFRRVSSVKNRDLIHRQQSDAQMQQISLPVRDEAQSSSELLPAWLQSAASDPNYRPRIERLAITDQMREDGEYIDPDKSPTTPPTTTPPTTPPPTTPPLANAPPLPPRQQGRPQRSSESGNGGGLYGNVSQPPLPPRASQRSSQPPGNAVPPLPPRSQNGPRRPDRKSGEGNRKAYFSKIFNGCPLHLNCASSWTHPISKLQYVLFGAEEGLFSLLVTNNPDPVMEQVSSRPCHWIRVVENSMIWLSGRSNRIVSMTNLILLFQSESARASLQHRSRQHTSKITDSRGCTKCCIARNPFTDQRYLIAAIPRGILLLQWFQPRHAFMHVMLFECQIPQPLNLLEAYVVENEEYPIVVLGVKESADGTVLFETLNLNSQASWYSDQPDGRSLNILSLQQLEKDTIFVGMERAAKFVGRNGQLKPSTVQASHITFEKTSEHMVFLSNCVLSFHRHGMQGKSLATQQVTAEVADGSKVFHLLGSHGTIVIETRPADELTSPSNIYILVSEDTAPQP